jgi:hypothetical protein
MGYGLTTYAVSADKLRSAFGSRDERLLHHVLSVYGDDMASDDARYETALPEAEVMREIIYGTISLPNEGSLYSFTFEYLCRYFGAWLSNRHFYPCNSQHLSRMDDALNLPVKLMDLVNGELPVKLPRPDDFPGVGYWTPEQIAEGAAQLRRLNLERPDKALADALREMPHLPNQVRGIRDWLTSARRRRNGIVVGYYS